MSVITYRMALGYGSCGHKNLWIQLPPTSILITLTLLFALPEPPVLPCFILSKLGSRSRRDCSFLWYLDRAPAKWGMVPVKMFACGSALWYNCTQRYQISLKELVWPCRVTARGDAHPLWLLHQPGTAIRFPISAPVPFDFESLSWSGMSRAL